MQLVAIAKWYFNTADLIAMVDTKLLTAEQRDIAINDLQYIIHKYTRIMYNDE